MLTRLNIFSAPTKTITIGKSSLWIGTIGHGSDPHGKTNAYHGTIVILNPTSEHTLRDVIVDTAISTSAVKVTPNLECTVSIRRTDQPT